MVPPAGQAENKKLTTYVAGQAENRKPTESVTGQARTEN
jgi:hypothetical protein